MRCFAWLLLAAFPWAVRAQTPPRCASAVERAVEADARHAAPPQRLVLARTARRCFGAVRSLHASHLYAYEASALAETNRWPELLALADTFRAAGYDASNAPGSYVQLQRLAALAKVATGRASDGLADLRALGPLAQRMPSTRYRVELRLTLARCFRFLGDLDAAEREANAAAASLGDEPRPLRDALAAQAKQMQAAILNDRFDLDPSTDAAVFLPTTRWLRDADSLARVAADPTLGETIRIEQARSMLAQGHVAAAERRLRSLRPADGRRRATVLEYRAEAAFRNQRPSDALRLLAAAAALVPLAERGRLLSRRGELLEASAQPAAAELAYREALEASAQGWRASGSDEALLLRRSPDERAVRGLVRVLVAQGRATEAFALQDGYRARLLALYRARAQSRPNRSNAAFSDALAALEAARDSLRLPDGDRHHVRLSAKIQRLQAQLARLQPLPPPTPTDVAALHQSLRASNQVLVAYVLAAPLAPGEAPRSVALVVTPDTVRAVPIPLSPRETEALIATAAPLLASTPSAIRNDFDLHALHRLYQRLIEPLALPPQQRLVVVPDGPLFALPFAMLVTNETGRFDLDRARFLVEDRAVSVELAAALRLMSAPAAPTDSMLVVARTDYARAHLPDLPSVNAEVRGLRPWPYAAVMMNERALALTFRRRAPNARFVHLAAHTDVTARSPLDFAFRLWPSDSSSGRLTVSDVLRTPLRADLVVLSGCSTAQGEAHASEGMLGLQYGVRAAGAKSVLATLWMADDDATAALVGHFYDGLRNGLPRDEALRQAQTFVLLANDGRRRSPYLWAAPVLYGDAGPALPGRPRMRFGGIVAWTVALGAACALAYGFIRRHYDR